MGYTFFLNSQKQIMSCLKWGISCLSLVWNGVQKIGFSCLKWSQGFKAWAAHPHPKYGQACPPPHHPHPPGSKKLGRLQYILLSCAVSPTEMLWVGARSESGNWRRFWAPADRFQLWDLNLLHHAPAVFAPVKMKMWIDLYTNRNNLILIVTCFVYILLHFFQLLLLLNI